MGDRFQYGWVLNLKSTLSKSVLGSEIGNQIGQGRFQFLELGNRTSPLWIEPIADSYIAIATNLWYQLININSGICVWPRQIKKKCKKRGGGEGGGTNPFVWVLKQ